MPVIALRGLTIFPNVLIHFDVAREISIKALEEAMTSGSPVFLVGQKDISVESRRRRTFTLWAPSPMCGRSSACPGTTCG